MVTGLFAMMGIDGVEEDIVEERSKEMLKIIDSDGDGEITKEEFLENAMTCEFICDMFQIGALDEIGEGEEGDATVVDLEAEANDLRKGLDFGVLERKLGLTNEEIEEEFDMFTEFYTFGEMTRKEFVAYCNKTDGLTYEEAESLFNVFDADGSGTMDFMEFMMAKNATDLRWLSPSTSLLLAPLLLAPCSLLLAPCSLLFIV